MKNKKKKKQAKNIKQNPTLLLSFQPLHCLVFHLSGAGSGCVSLRILFCPDILICECSLCNMWLVSFKASGMPSILDPYLGSF